PRAQIATKRLGRLAAGRSIGEQRFEVRLGYEMAVESRQHLNHVGLRPTPRLGRLRGPLRPAPLPPTPTRTNRASGTPARRRAVRAFLLPHPNARTGRASAHRL